MSAEHDEHLRLLIIQRDYRPEQLPLWALHIIHLLEHLMATQSELDAAVTSLNESFAAVEAEVAALKTQPAAAALDFSGLDAVVARGKADVPAPAAAPVVDSSAPVADPAAPVGTDPATTPVDTTTAPVEGSTPVDPNAPVA